MPAASAGDRLNITVEGHQYYWQFNYPNGARSIGDLHVPAHTVVYLTIVSPDVAHSWWIPQLGGKTDAIPGKTNHTWFKADREGTYTGQCAEFCGIFHEAMHASRDRDVERRLRALARRRRRRPTSGARSSRASARRATA